MMPLLNSVSPSTSSNCNMSPVFPASVFLQNQCFSLVGSVTDKLHHNLFVCMPEHFLLILGQNFLASYPAWVGAAAVSLSCSLAGQFLLLANGDVLFLVMRWLISVTPVPLVSLLLVLVMAFSYGRTSPSTSQQREPPSLEDRWSEHAFANGGGQSNSQKTWEFQRNLA